MNLTDNLVLIVDDMAVMRKVVRKELFNMGYKKTIEAGNGQEAWQKLQTSTEKVDLIISDWNMPVAKGIDLLKQVRSSEKFKKTPFILLTAMRGGEYIQEAIQAGVDHYIVKPFDQNTLKTKIHQVNKKQRMANQ